MENEEAMDCEENDELELEAIKRRLADMEEEARLLKKQTLEDGEENRTPIGCNGDLQREPISEKMSKATEGGESQRNRVDDTTGQYTTFDEESIEENKIESDSRSVYIGNVDYGTSVDDLKSHFQECGELNRVTIICDKFTKQPKGFAYVEFVKMESVEKAIAMDSSTLRDRTLEIMRKRTNIPGISSTDRPPRGFPVRGRGYVPLRGQAARRPTRGRFLGRGRHGGRFGGRSSTRSRGYNAFYTPHY